MRRSEIPTKGYKFGEKAKPLSNEAKNVAPTRTTNFIPRTDYAKTGPLAWMARHTSAAALENAYATQADSRFSCPLKQ